MTRIIWGNPSEKTYETGLSRGVLYATNQNPVPWNGLVSITENVAGGEVESYYYDGVKYLDAILYEDFQATLEAFDSPDEFYECDGQRQLALGLFATQQVRKPFGLSWRTEIGNELSESAGYKLHILWGCMAAPSEKVSTTRNADASLASRSWTLYSTPPVAGSYGGATYKPTAHFVIDSRAGNPFVGILEDGLYGKPSAAPFFPTQQQVLTLLNDGTWS